MSTNPAYRSIWKFQVVTMVFLVIGYLWLLIVNICDLSLAQRHDGQYWPCNPLKNATGACTPNRGLSSSTYSIDFTKQTSLPEDWSISNYATVNYGPLGAEFTFAKRYDAPQLWTDFYILFGKVKINMQVANGTGIISSAVLISDDFDEIDFEFSGNNFGDAGSAGVGQNNYFGKGITGSYDRGAHFNVASPQYSFHTYEVDWTPESLTWLVDGQAVRTLLRSQTDNGAHQYPETPSKLQLGLWDGGDPGQNSGTKAWAGGLTDFSQVPFTFYVKSVEIENMYPAAAYNYTDQSGRWQSIQLLQADPNPPSTSDQASVSLNAPVANTTSSSTMITSNESSLLPTMLPWTSTEETSSESAQEDSSMTLSSTNEAHSSTSETRHGSTIPSFAVSTWLHSSTSPISSKGTSIPFSTSSSSSQLASDTSTSVKAQTPTSNAGSTLSTFCKTSTTSSILKASASSSRNTVLNSPPIKTSTTCTSKTSNRITIGPASITSSSDRKTAQSTRIPPTSKTTSCTGQIQSSNGWLNWIAGHDVDLNRWGVRHGRLPMYRMEHE